MMDTVAPGIAAPVWSVMVPRIRPKLPCENSGSENSNRPRVVPSIFFNVADFIGAPFRGSVPILLAWDYMPRLEEAEGGLVNRVVNMSSVRWNQNMICPL